MISYVFGVTYPIDDIIKLCKKHNIYVIEDLAETFHSLKFNGLFASLVFVCNYVLGHPDADISLFSFGSIKYNTAFGGCLNVVRNDDVLYRKMKYIQDQYPMQPTSTYLKKCVKMGFPTFLLNNRYANYSIRMFGRLTDIDVREYGISLVR